MSADATPHSNQDQSQTSPGDERIDDVLVRHAKESIELAIWLKGFFDLLIALNQRADVEKLHFKLMVKLLLETLAFRKLEVWIAEDRLIQAETGIRTDKQHRPLKDLEAWGIIQRDYDERGYRYRILVNVSDWKAPLAEECRRPLKNRSKYIRRARNQLSFEFLSREVKDKITELHFEAFGDAMRNGLEGPDGKAIPPDGGLSATRVAPFTHGGGLQPGSHSAFTPGGGVPDEAFTLGRGMPRENTGAATLHSPLAGDARPRERERESTKKYLSFSLPKEG